MSTWMLVLYIAGAALMLWFMLRTIRNNPQAFSKENLGKSFFTIGILALLIIGVIAICILFLRST